MTKKEKEQKGYWVHTVTTDIVAVPKGILTKEPAEIARVLLKVNKYPGVHGSVNRFLQYYLNRGGKNITTERRESIRKAQEIIRQKKSGKKTG